MRNFWMAMVFAASLAMFGCGSGTADPSQGNASTPTVPVGVKTESVNLVIDLRPGATMANVTSASENVTAKAVMVETVKAIKVAKTTKSANLAKSTKKSAQMAAAPVVPMTREQKIQSYKDEVTNIDIFVRSMNGGIHVTQFLDMPVVNGVFNSMNSDGTSKINLPAGEYIFQVDCDNADNTARFSGWGSIPVIAGEPNVFNIGVGLNNIYVDVAISQFQGNFVKSDGSYTAPYYEGTVTTDDGIDYGSDELAYMDQSGTLHLVMEVNPLDSTMAWVSITDGNGADIVQALVLDMTVVMAAERNGLDVPYVFQKNSGINITVSFPS